MGIRDKINNRTKVKLKYFPQGNTYIYKGVPHNDNWVLVGSKKLLGDKLNHVFLPKFSWHKSITHIKIRPFSSIDDGNELYWSKRTLEFGGFSYSQKRLLKRQKGSCTWCSSPINITDNVEVDHLISKAKGGLSSYDNLQLLHKQCHIEKTGLDSHIDKSGPQLKIIQL